MVAPSSRPYIKCAMPKTKVGMAMRAEWPPGRIKSSAIMNKINPYALPNDKEYRVE